jgi:peptidoglycan/xylan/chitin deacetylase (PgdA/CDA1 family)
VLTCRGDTVNAVAKRIVALLSMIALVSTCAGAVDAQALSVLKPGSKGAEVERLQRSLIALGYRIKADGVFGPHTAQAVRKLQASSGLKQDGLVGKNTWSAINAAVLLQQMIRQGVYIVQRGDTIASIASRLKISQASLIQANSLAVGKSLFAGQALSIPSGAGQNAPRAAPPAEAVLAAPARKVALTFDDTPRATYLTGIIAVLDARGIKATLFVTGETLTRYHQELRGAARSGHVIENHGPGSQGILSPTVSRIASDIETVATLIEQVSGRRSALFRPLSIAAPGPFAEAAALAGHRMVMWSNLGRPDDDLLLQATQAALFDGAVLRFSLDDPQVLSVLPALLDDIAARGFAAGPLDP